MSTKRPVDAEPQEDLHRYNDDLLLSGEALLRATAEFPLVIHVLDHQELRDAFAEADQAASCAKRHSQAAGFWAILCALAALMTASSAPAWEHVHRPWLTVIAVASALLGVAAATVTWFGLLHGRQKAEWLYRRLYTERLRQFHFQTMIWRLHEISLSLQSPAGPAGFKKARSEWFADFQNRFSPGRRGDKLAALLDPGVVPEVWIHDIVNGRHPSIPKSVNLLELFRAYKRLRFDEQFYYAVHVLRTANSPPGARGRSGALARRLLFPMTGWPLRKQQDLLRFIWVGAFALLLAGHFAVVACYLWRPPCGIWLHVGIVWSALVAIAAKTLADGLGLARELERYQEYRAIVAELRSRFNPAGDSRECIEQMMELERASFEEMRSFLRTHNDCTFVL